jgi:hypothetical protein
VVPSIREVGRETASALENSDETSNRGLASLRDECIFNSSNSQKSNRVAHMEDTHMEDADMEDVAKQMPPFLAPDQKRGADYGTNFLYQF